MISYRLIFGASALTFAATMMVTSDGAFRQASEAMGFSSSAEYSVWDYNPLTLLSVERVKKLMSDSEGNIPEMKPFYGKNPDLKFDGTALNGLQSDFGDSHLAGVD